MNKAEEQSSVAASQTLPLPVFHVQPIAPAMTMLRNHRTARIPWTITFHVFLTVFALVAFTAILLGLVFSNTWLKRKDPIPGLDLSSGYESNDIYVDYSATSLVLVASWSSSVALPMIGSMMGVASYAVAADILWTSRHRMLRMLPTPSQLAVLTDLVDAKQWTLFAWLVERWTCARRKSGTRWTIEFCAITQTTLLVIRSVIL